MLQQTETTFKGLTIWLEGGNKKIVKQTAAALARWVKLNQENLFEKRTIETFSAYLKPGGESK